MQIPEVSYLLSEVEKKYGRRIATSTDFESLSVTIDIMTGELLSSSTLKRLWGYVSANPTPRTSTLDVLSRYIGHRSFKEFCEGLKSSNVYASTFFSSRVLDIDSLRVGQHVCLGWDPNRLVEMEYLGNRNFRVTSSANSQLKVDDTFELFEVILGYPLVILKILRDGKYTNPYIAGRQGGLNYMKILD